MIRTSGTANHSLSRFSSSEERPRIVPPEIDVSTEMNGLCQKMAWIERFALFQHGPGDHQHLGGDLDACLGPDPSLSLTPFEHPVKNTTKGIVVIT